MLALPGRRLGQHEIAEVGVLRGGAICPEHENRAALLGAMWAVHIAGLEVKRRAWLVALAFVDEFAFHHVERLRKALVIMRRDHGPGLHDDVQHHWPKRKTRVADDQRDIPLTREGEAIGLE